MAGWKRPLSEIVQQLKNHRRALQASARGYDAGEKWEAQRLATTVYTLVHDGGKNSRSILTQLGLRASLRFVSSSHPLDPTNLFTDQALVMTRVTNEKAEIVPFLGDGPFPTRIVQFHTWWNDEGIFRDEHHTVNRRQLVFALRNKEGGSHLDATLDEDGYLMMSRESAKSAYFGYGGNEPVPVLGVELASMRQVAWELIETLESLGAEYR